MTNMEMEEVDCPICQGSRGDPLHLEGSFQMVRCHSCRFIFLNPRPTMDSLLRFYQKYLPEESASIESWEEMMRPIFHRAANLLKQYGRKGRLLDVGTGFGFFLVEMKKRGWEAAGVEISQKAIDYARDVLGLTILCGPLEKADFPDNDFDAVTAFYVIEHLSHPMAFLRECHRILKPGGLLLLRYPHTTPIKTLLHFFGIKNRLYDLPAHLSDFSPRMIQECLERIGFEKCRHLIGGYTLPGDFGKRISSILFGSFAEALFCLSGKKLLFPGVSKTILAFKGERR
ncbi:MAG: class I SAM-dependent methyltransferase [Desulfobacterales bacterium]|nr:class I SAM-dependent methyltransferase [Desulfobacterales bacterium]